jgi:hypothetical protein
MARSELGSGHFVGLHGNSKLEETEELSHLNRVNLFVAPEDIRFWTFVETEFVDMDLATNQLSEGTNTPKSCDQGGCFGFW